jgi:hypothetical protein
VPFRRAARSARYPIGQGPWGGCRPTACVRVAQHRTPWPPGGRRSPPTRRVVRVDRDTLAVRFKINDVDPGESWQLFLSDNGTRVYSGTKTASSDGEVRVRRRIADRRAPTGSA